VSSIIFARTSLSRFEINLTMNSRSVLIRFDRSLLIWQTNVVAMFMITVRLQSPRRASFAETMRWRMPLIWHLSQEFFSCGAPNRWLCYNFKNVEIKSRHYSIRSYCGSWGYLLKSWVVERSNDGKSWIELDRRESQSRAARCCITKTLAISRSERVRMIRIRQTAEHDGFHNFEVSKFEISGFLILWRATE